MLIEIWEEQKNKLSRSGARATAPTTTSEDEEEEEEEEAGREGQHDDIEQVYSQGHHYS
jgi:hypothetical protein